MKTKNLQIGHMGESLACDFLLAKGYRILHRNYRSGHLETDIICENETHILFVEVKTRMDTEALLRFGRPGAAVDTRKKKNITACAEEYIYRNKTEKQPRIDVIEVYLKRVGGEYALSEKGICHIENALC